MKTFRYVNLSDFLMVKHKHNDWKYSTCYICGVTTLVATKHQDSRVVLT